MWRTEFAATGRVKYFIKKKLDKKVRNQKVASMRSFLLTFLTTYYGATLFVVLHTFDLLKPFKLKYVIVLCYILLSTAVFLGRFWGNHFPLNISAWLARIGYVWMGLLVYMFVWSLTFLILRLFKIGPVLNKSRLILFLFEVILVFIILVIGYINANTVRITKHKLETSKQVSLRVVQITDNHLGFMNSEYRFSKIVEKIRTLEPDILLITGDFLENEHDYAIKNDIGRALRNMKLSMGIYAITGNHEYIANIDKSMEYMESLGIVMLRDEVKIFEDESLRLIGREDTSKERRYNKPNQTLEYLLKQGDDNGDLFTIVMDHQVKKHNEYEVEAIDLVISGHTHYGQLFPFNLVTKRIFDIAYGLEKWGNTYMYVSSGTGVWGPPMRLGTRSEIVVFDIVPTASRR